MFLLFVQVNTSLTSLDIGENEISTLPPAVLPALRRLKEFQCSGNPWTNPPKEVMDKGLQEIIKFMSRLEAEGKETCNLAMLAILGKGEVTTHTLSNCSTFKYLFIRLSVFQVGKTSLLRALLAPNNRTEAIDKEDRTIGLDLVRWVVKQTLPSSALTLNVQDFAGQEIYYATHHLFLSPRAAYILVFDASREDVEAQVEPWLDSLQANVPGALVLLVATHTAPDLVSPATLKARVARVTQCCQRLLERHRAALERKIKQLREHIDSGFKCEANEVDDSGDQKPQKKEKKKVRREKKVGRSFGFLGAFFPGKRKSKQRPATGADLAHSKPPSLIDGRGPAEENNRSQQHRRAAQVELKRLASSHGQQVTLLQVHNNAMSFCVDSLAAVGVKALREELAEAVQQLPQVGVDIPKSFAAVLARIQSMRDKLMGSKESLLLHWNDFCEQIRNTNIQGQQEEVKLDDQTLTDAVQFWSALGEVYHRDDFVVLSPSYIVDSIKELVRHNRPDPRDPDLRKSFHKLKAKGILDQQLLQNLLWKDFDNFAQKKLLVALEQFKVLHPLEKPQQVQVSPGPGGGHAAADSARTAPAGNSWMCPCLVEDTAPEPRLMARLVEAYLCDYYIPLLPADLFPCLLVELFREDRGYFLPTIGRVALLTCKERNDSGKYGQCFVMVSQPSRGELVAAQHTPSAEPHFVAKEECGWRVSISATDRGLFQFVESKLRRRLQQYYMVTYPLRPCPNCPQAEAFRFNLDLLQLDRPKSSVMCPNCHNPTQLERLVFVQASQIFISYNWGKRGPNGKYDNQQKVNENPSQFSSNSLTFDLRSRS